MESNNIFCYNNIISYLSFQEVAKRETRRVQSARSKKRLGFSTPEDLFHQEPDGNQAERCVIC